MLDTTELIGLIAGCLVSVSFLPQLIKSWKTKSLNDITYSTTLINVGGQILWITYGIRMQAVSLIIMSSVTLIMTLSLFVLKFRYRNST